MERSTNPPQSIKMKHYYKNKDNILAYYKSYYQMNKEKLKRQRRERYARQRNQRIANDFEREQIMEQLVEIIREETE